MSSRLALSLGIIAASSISASTKVPLNFGDTITLISPNKTNNSQQALAHFDVTLDKDMHTQKLIFKPGFTSPTDRASAWRIESATGMNGQIHYQHQIRLIDQDSTWQNFEGDRICCAALGSEDEKKFWVLTGDRISPGAWETWTLVNPTDKDPNHPDTSVINSGDSVAFKSNFGRYLTAEKDNSGQNANRTELGPYQIWTLTKR